MRVCRTRSRGGRCRSIGLAEIPRVQDVQLSPDGHAVSYMLARADWKANRMLPHIWRQAVAGGPPVQITNGETGESLARWSPDGQTLLFLGRGSVGQQIFLVSAAGGTPRQLTRHATSVYGGAVPAWSPDGSTIYFLASDPPTDLERERQRLRDDVYVFEEDYQQRQLWKIDVATGAEQKLTDAKETLLSFRLSRNGRLLLSQRAPTPLAGDLYRSEIWISDADGQHARKLTGNDVEEFDAELSPDQQRVLFLADAGPRLEPYYNSALFIVDAAGGTPTPVLRDFPYQVERAAWANDSHHRRHRQHGAAQRSVSHRRGQRIGAAADRRPAFGAVLELLAIGGPDGFSDRRTIATRATRGRCRWTAVRRRASPASMTRSTATSSCRARRRSPGRAPTA